MCGVPFKEGVVGEEIEKRLERAVKFINTTKAEFVVSIGDLTDSGILKQFWTAREICDRLKKPFIPLIGNHDLWPYRRRDGKKEVIWEAKRPLTIVEFEANFPEWKNSPCFESFKEQGGWLQNYTFVVKGVRFVVVDNNNRRKAPFGFPGQSGWAKLYPESKEWLRNYVLSSREDRIIILSHTPLAKRLLKELPSETEKKLLAISGHTHKRTDWEWRNVRRVTTNALYHEPLLLIVKVSPEIKTEYHQI